MVVVGLLPRVMNSRTSGTAIIAQITKNGITRLARRGSGGTVNSSWVWLVISHPHLGHFSDSANLCSFFLLVVALDGCVGGEQPNSLAQRQWRDWRDSVSIMCHFWQADTDLSGGAAVRLEPVLGGLAQKKRSYEAQIIAQF